MENLTLIPIEKLDNFQAELNEIKSLLKGNKKEELLNKWLSKGEARQRLNVCMKTLDSYLSRGDLGERFISRLLILKPTWKNIISRYHKNGGVL